MTVYYEDSRCDGCNKWLAFGDTCYCKECYKSVAKQISVLQRIKRALEAEIEVLNLEKVGAY